MATPLSNQEPDHEEHRTLKGPEWAPRSSDAVLTYNRRTGRFKVDNGTILGTAKIVTVETEHGIYNVTRNSNGDYTKQKVSSTR